MSELSNLMESLNWTELSDWDRSAATGRLRDQVLALRQRSKGSVESKRLTSLLYRLEFQRLKDKQEQTRLKDESLWQTACQFSLAWNELGNKVFKDGKNFASNAPEYFEHAH